MTTGRDRKKQVDNQTVKETRRYTRSLGANQATEQQSLPRNLVYILHNKQHTHIQQSNKHLDYKKQ